MIFCAVTMKKVMNWFPNNRLLGYCRGPKIASKTIGWKKSLRLIWHFQKCRYSWCSRRSTIFIFQAKILLRIKSDLYKSVLWTPNCRVFENKRRTSGSLDFRVDGNISVKNVYIQLIRRRNKSFWLLLIFFYVRCTLYNYSKYLHRSFLNSNDLPH